MPKILVTGGTGVLGREVVPVLTERGADVRTLSRRPRQVGGVETIHGNMING